jgi:hypothetical protein
MRLPRVRFTVRRLMLVVAFVAVLIGLVVLKQRRDRFRLQAALFVDEGRTLLVMADASARRSVQLEAAGVQGQVSTLRDYERRCRDQAEYAATLGRKYEFAASRPWLQVSPDPPKPE